MSAGQPDPVVVVCGADARYACPLAVLLRSVRDHLGTGRSVEFHVIDGGLTPELRLRVMAGLDHPGTRVQWMRPDRSRFVGLPLWGRMTVATYDKLLLPELLDASVRRALWLDADILALEDVGRLWDLPLNGRLALAVEDPLVPTVGSPFGVAGHRALGLSGALPHFNAGVLLVDVEGWRRAAVTQRALEYLQRFHRQVYFWDQEALNAVLAGDWQPLDPRWNRNPDRLVRGESAGLLHFTGNLKPWLYPGQTPAHERYLAVLDRTAWRGWRPHGRRSAGMDWYQASALRQALRPMEAWGMRYWRRRTLRRAVESDLKGGVTTGQREATHEAYRA